MTSDQENGLRARIAKMMDSKNMPFDVKRMAYGGFRVIVAR